MRQPVSVSASELSEGRRPRGRDPRDQIEELEDQNDKLQRATERVERRLGELERQIAGTDERTERAVSVARREMMGFLEQSVQETQRSVLAGRFLIVCERRSKSEALKEDDEAILGKLQVVRLF